MSSTELYGDDMHLTSIEADGVCIATPTGSTAYNLAAGGSLCHPEIPAMLVRITSKYTISRSCSLLILFLSGLADMRTQSNLQALDLARLDGLTCWRPLRCSHDGVGVFRRASED